MTNINRLSASDAIGASDLVPVWSSNNSDTRRATVNTLAQAIQPLIQDDVTQEVLTELSLPDGAASVGFLQVGAGAVTRSMQSKERDIFSLKDFGALGNGVGNDTTAVSNAIAAMPSGGWINSTPGVYDTTLSSGAITGVFRGSGQIRDVANNLRAPNFTAVTTAPFPLGNEDSVETAFNGDVSKVFQAVEHRITGAATLGQPTAGYLYRPEAMPHYTYLLNQSGHNESLSGNGGRTGVAAYRTRVFQAGQGDAMCFNGSVFVTGTKPGSTSFLANPAGALFCGDMTAGADGVYLNPYETFCTDIGFDAACVGIVNNFERTNGAGAKGVYWGGYRAQNVGTDPCDVVVSATGKWITGLDFSQTGCDFGANKAAVSLKANDRIYLNNAAGASGSLPADIRATVFNGDYIAYSTSINGMLFSVGGNPNLQITNTQVAIGQSMRHTGSSLGFFNASPVAKSTITGSRANTSSGALNELLIALHSLGLITNNSVV